VDFIERFFGLAPDRGNGALEIFLLSFPFVIALVVLFGRRLARVIPTRDRSGLEIKPR
jgi:hypothetical protein